MLVHSNYIPKIDLVYEQFLDFNEADFQLPMLNKGFSAELPKLLAEISEILTEVKTHQEPIPAPVIPIENLCRVCYCEEQDPLTLECTHKFCKVCVVAIITNNLNSSVLENKCPDCNIALKEDFVLSQLAEEEIARFKKFKQRKIGLDLVSQNLAVWCVKPDCVGFAHILDNVPNGACNACKRVFCLKCKGDVHPGVDCDNHEKDNELQDVLGSMEWKQCPCCGVPVERIDGCNFIPCESPMCQGRFPFCYQCGKILCEDLHWNHYTTEGPFGNTCNTLQGIPDPYVPYHHWPHYNDERHKHLIKRPGVEGDVDIEPFNPDWFNEEVEEIAAQPEEIQAPQPAQQAAPQRVNRPQRRVNRVHNHDIEVFYAPNMFAEEGDEIIAENEEVNEEEVFFDNLFGDEEVNEEENRINEEVRVQENVNDDIDLGDLFA